MNSKVIAIDFDGTITKDSKYPITGVIDLNAIDHIKKIKKLGHKIILWTCREGDELKEAIDLCSFHGIYFDSINENKNGNSRKIRADFYIDNKSNINNKVNWEEIVKWLKL